MVHTISFDHTSSFEDLVKFFKVLDKSHGLAIVDCTELLDHEFVKFENKLHLMFETFVPQCTIVFKHVNTLLTNNRSHTKYVYGCHVLPVSDTIWMIDISSSIIPRQRTPPTILLKLSHDIETDMKTLNYYSSGYKYMTISNDCVKFSDSCW